MRIIQPDIDQAISDMKFKIQLNKHSDHMHDLNQNECLLSNLEFAKKLINELGFDPVFYERSGVRYEWESNSLIFENSVLVSNVKSIEQVLNVLRPIEEQKYM
jgi:hypothetical protein